MPTKPYLIVVGTDYSKPAERAFHAAYEQARMHTPAELHVAHVAIAVGADLAYPVAGFGVGAAPVLNLDEQRDGLVKYLDSLIPKLADFAEGQVRVIAHVVLDAPVFGLTNLASELEADMIVVGSHGRHGLARWLLGSVAEGVVRQATCPVLVVPPEATALQAPAIQPPCPQCVLERKASEGREMWCEQHRERHGRRHTYYQGDRASTETNLPLIAR